jgi:hypothetical protein
VCLMTRAELCAIVAKVAPGLSPEQRKKVAAFVLAVFHGGNADNTREREHSRMARERAFEEEQLSARGLPPEAARQSRCP